MHVKHIVNSGVSLHSITSSFQSCEAKKTVFFFCGTATVELLQKNTCYFGGKFCYFSGPSSTRGIRHSSAIFLRPLSRTQNMARCQNVLRLQMGANKTYPTMCPLAPPAGAGGRPISYQVLEDVKVCLLSVPRHLVTLFPSLARELKLYRCPVALGFGRFEITYLTIYQSHIPSKSVFLKVLKPLLFYCHISFEPPFPHAEVLSNAVQQVSSHRCIFAEECHTCGVLIS